MFHEYRRPFIGPKLVFLEQGVFLERCRYVPCRNVDENENEVAQDFFLFTYESRDDWFEMRREAFYVTLIDSRKRNQILPQCSFNTIAKNSWKTSLKSSSDQNLPGSQSPWLNLCQISCGQIYRRKTQYLVRFI